MMISISSTTWRISFGLHPDRTEYSYFSHADSGFRIDHCTVRPRSPQRHSVTDL
jgi:hypothetical protein